MNAPAADAAPAQHTCLSKQLAKKQRAKVARAKRKEQDAIDMVQKQEQASQAQAALQKQKVAASRSCLEAINSMARMTRSHEPYPESFPSPNPNPICTDKEARVTPTCLIYQESDQPTSSLKRRKV